MLSVYLALFVLLHSCAMLTKRDAEYARQNNLQGKYANPEAIREHQKGAITLLAHFHGVLGGPIPFGLAGTGRLESYNKKNWNFSEEQETFMRETYLRTRVMGEYSHLERNSLTAGAPSDTFLDRQGFSAVEAEGRFERSVVLGFAVVRRELDTR